MRNGFILNAMASAVLIAASSAVIAAPAFDGNNIGFVSDWKITDNKVTPGCLTGAGGVSCSAEIPVEANTGFGQFRVKDAAGDVYILTVVTDQNATSADSVQFRDQSLVKISNNGSNTAQSGIYASQRIDQPGATQSQGIFTSDTKINTSNFVASTGATVTIDQSVKSVTALAGQPPAPNDFVSSFWYQSQNDANGVVKGMKMEIDQLANLKDKNGGDNDLQSFTLREVKGDFLKASATGVQLTAATNWSGRPATGAPASQDVTVNWAAGEDVKAIWLGQYVDLSSVPGSSGGGGIPNGSTFGYLSFENVATSKWASRAALDNSPVLDSSKPSTGLTIWDGTTFNVKGAAKGPCLYSPDGQLCQ